MKRLFFNYFNYILFFNNVKIKKKQLKRRKKQYNNLKIILLFNYFVNIVFVCFK